MIIKSIKMTLHADNENQINQKAQIGTFIIEFEEVCELIRMIILKMCYLRPTKIQRLNIEILLEGLTADPLRKKLQALIYDNYPIDSELQSLNKNISGKFLKLIELRNTIVHGVIIKSFGNNLSSDEFIHKHVKMTKNGVDKNIKIVNIKEIENMNKQTRIINGAYIQLLTILDKKSKGEDYGLIIKCTNEELNANADIRLQHEMKRTK